MLTGRNTNIPHDLVVDLGHANHIRVLVAGERADHLVDDPGEVSFSFGIPVPYPHGERVADALAGFSSVERLEIVEAKHLPSHAAQRTTDHVSKEPL